MQNTSPPKGPGGFERRSAMSRWGSTDIVIELVELCREISSGIKQQLPYYRASVYKHETAAQINTKIDHLRTVVALLGDENLLDHFLDYTATVANGNTVIAPGECFFSSRVSVLIQTLENNLDTVISRAKEPPPALSRNVKSQRRELMAMCRHGSRQWDFFKTL